MTEPIRPAPTTPRDGSILAWQGWQLTLPPRWNPVKLEGSREKGQALVADLYQARLGLLWHTPGKRKFDPKRWAERAMRDEVGTLAAAEAKPLVLDDPAWEVSLLYLDPEPPGRDVWVGYSRTTGRVLKVVHHARHRERVLQQSILPKLSDTARDAEQPWSAFELSCRMPAGFALQAQRLNAGDLGLRFGYKRREIVVRQIAVATLALQRMELDKWVDDQQKVAGRHFRAAGPYADVTLTTTDGRQLVGRQRRMVRRRRFFFAMSLPKALVTLALHDVARNRLVLLHGSDDELCQQVGKTVGWAQV